MVGIGESLQADLVSFQDLKSHNKGFQYILTVIDSFSKYGFAQPLKTKKTSEVAAAFRKIIDGYKYKRYIKNLCVDRGDFFSFYFSSK